MTLHIRKIWDFKPRSDDALHIKLARELNRTHPANDDTDKHERRERRSRLFLSTGELS